MTSRLPKSLVVAIMAIGLGAASCGGMDDNADDSDDGIQKESPPDGGSGAGGTSDTSDRPYRNQTSGGGGSGASGGTVGYGTTSGGSTSGSGSGGYGSTTSGTTGTGTGGSTGTTTGGGTGTSPHDGENYDETKENGFVDASKENTSTFSIDVDNGSYTLMRDDINAGRLPAEAGVRIEEYINFFDYGYTPPAQDKDRPFSIHTEAAPSKFAPKSSQNSMNLMRIGLQGREIPIAKMRPVNLVFLIDASGSMSDANKLPVVKESLRALTRNLRPSDRIGIVVYAGDDRLELPSTKVANKSTIDSTVARLTAGGSTNGEAGISRAYKMAERHKKQDGINRVVLCTDGDFNVGRTGQALTDLIEKYRKRHISLTTVGVGRGNYNDAQMEELARKGNGNYFYLDTIKEAKRIFGTELPSTFEVIAADVKIQVEFNANVVERYRLVGYENRKLDNDDFDDDTKDAGEIGPGHTVTAYYEVEMASAAAQSKDTTPLSTVRLRYKEAYGESSKKIVEPMELGSIRTGFKKASDGFQFGAAVAEYAEILRKSKHSTGARFGEVLSIAKRTSDQTQDKRQEFIGLVEDAKMLWAP